MFTLFDLLHLAAIGLGAGIGYEVGKPEHGILGGLAGAAIGVVAGRLPFVVALAVAGRSFRAQTTEQLRARLRGDEYYIAHLLLAELLRRGEDVAGELEPVLDLLRSDSAERRRFGLGSLRIAFPELATRLASYDPQESTERCREKVAAISGPDA